MDGWLKQSTATTVKLGPFLDESDGKTAETELTITYTDVRLAKNSGDMGPKNETSSATYDELGYYDCALDTTDTGTLGRLKIMVHEAGALPVWHTFMVVPAAVYDAMFGAAMLPVNVEKWNAVDVPSGQTEGYPEVALADGEIAALMAALLKGDWSSITGESAHSMLNAFRFLRNEWEVVDGVLYVYKEDGTTVAWSRLVTTDEDAPPVTGVGDSV